MPEKKLYQFISRHHWLKKPSVQTRLYGGNLLIKHLAAIEKEGNAFLENAADIEHIHQIRVSSRRSRNVLLLFSACFSNSSTNNWQKSLQNITRALGKTRDLDVQIDFLKKYYHQLPENKYQAGINRILLRLSQLRKKQYGLAEKTIRSYLQNSIRQEVEAALPRVVEQPDLPPIDLFLLATETIYWQVNNLLTLEESIYQANNQEPIHTLRVDIKRLRYTLESFSKLYEEAMIPYIKTLREFQDQLGIIHDLDVWLEFLPQFIEQEKKRTYQYFGHIRPMSRLMNGIDYFGQDCQVQREEKYQVFILAWKNTKEEDFWINLRQLAQKTLQQQRNARNKDLENSSEELPSD